MNLQETIRRVLREETELPAYIRRRVTANDLEWLVRDVKISLSGGKNKSDALYDAIQNLISSNRELLKDYDAFQDVYAFDEPLIKYINSRLDDEPLNESILREERELPSFFKRRIDMENIEQIYVYLLKVESKRYTDNKKRLNAMTPYKFNNIVTSKLLEELCDNYELQCDDEGFNFKGLWDFLNDRYSKRNLKQFYEIR